MAVAFDAVGPSSAGTGTEGTTSINWSHTCTGSNRLLVVGACMGAGNNTVTLTVTYNSVAMTSAGRINSNTPSDDGYVEMFYLVAPATGAHTVVVTCDGTRDLLGGSVSFTGVDQATPVSGATTSAGDSGSPSVTVSSNSGDMVVDALCCGNGTGTPITSGQTNRWTKTLNNGSGAGNGAQSTASGSASVNMTYTTQSDWWGMVGMNLKASAPTSGPVTAWLTA